MDKNSQYREEGKKGRKEYARHKKTSKKNTG
jgi:hypothetical protein